MSGSNETTLRHIIERVGDGALNRPVVFVSDEQVYVFDDTDDDGELLIVNVRRETDPREWGLR